MRQINSEATGAAQKVEDLSDTLSRVKAKADPAQNAYEQLAKNIDVLKRSVDANLISQDRAVKLGANLAAGAQAQIRPYATLISSINAEARAYQLSGAARTASLRTMQQTATLQRQGIALNSEQVASLERVNLAYAQTREAATLAEKAQADAARASVQASRQAEQAAERAAAAQAKRSSAIEGVGRRNTGATSALRQGGTQGAASLRSLEQIEALKRTGITLTADETAAIEAQNTAYAEQKAALASIEETKRGLASVRAQARTPQQSAINQYNQGSNTIGKAASAGLIGGAEAVSLQKQLAQALNEQINPLDKTNRMLVERAEYQAGLAESGRALAQVERDIAAAQELGIATSASEIAGLRQQAVAIDNTARAYVSIDKVKGIFNSTAGGIGLLFGGEEVAHSLDQVQNLQNLLSVTSQGAGNQASLTDKIFDISRQTHSEVEDTAKLYTRLDLSVASFGVGQSRVLAVTTAINEQIRLSGTSQGEATRAITDFTHAVSAGNVQYRELRALTTQAPFVAKSLAEGLTKLAQADAGFQKRALGAGVNAAKGVNVGDLRELTSKKAIGSGDVFKAVELQEADTEAAFKKLAPTISQAMGDVHTEFLKFLNDVNQSTGVARGLGSGIEFIADHLNQIIPPLIIVGALFAGAFVKNRIDDVVAIVDVFTQKLVGVKPAATAAQIALDADTAAILANNEQLIAQNGLLTQNSEKFGVNAGAVRGNAVARDATNLAGGAGGFKTASTARGLTAGEIGGAAAGLEGAEGAAGAAAGVGEATAAVGGLGAAVAGVGGTISGVVAGVGGFITAIVGGIGAALPIIFALGAAWLLLKDNISLAKDQQLLYADGVDKNGDAAIKAVQGNITLGDTVGGVFSALLGKTNDLTAAQQKSEADKTSAAQAGSATRLGIGAAETDAAVKAEKTKSDAAVANFQKTDSAYQSLNSDLIRGIVTFAADFGIGAIAISQAWNELWANFKVGALAVLEVVANAFIDFYNNTVVKVLNAGKAVGIGSGLTAASHVSLGVGAAEQQRNNLAKGDQQSLANAIKGLPEQIARSIIGSAANRTRGRGTGVSDGTGEPPDLAGTPKKAKKDPLDKEFDDLLKKTLPAVEAIKKFNDQMDILTKATNKGLVQKAADENNTYDKAHPEYGLGQISAATLASRIQAQAARERDSIVNPSAGFQEAQTNERTNLAASPGKPYDRTIATGISQEEEKEAKALALTVDEFKQLHPAMVAVISDQVRLTEAAKEQSQVNDALAAQNQQRSLQLSQLGESTQLVQAQNEAYAIYKDQILSGNAAAVVAYDQRVKDNLSFIAYTENVTKTVAAYNEIVGPANTYRDTVVNLNNLLDSGLISLQKYNEELRDGASKALSSATDGFSGFQRGVLDIKKETSDTAADMESTFKDAYNNIQSGFSSLFTGGTLKDAAHKVFEGITNDLSKTLFQKISDPIVNSIGKASGTPGFGDKAINATRVDLNATTVVVNGQQAANQNGLGGVAAGTNLNTAPAYNFTAPGANNLTNTDFSAGLSRFGVGNTDPFGFLTNGSNSAYTGNSNLSTTGFNIANYNPLGLAPAASNLFGGVGNIGSSLGLPGVGPAGSAASSLTSSLTGGIGTGIPGTGNAVPVTVVGSTASGGANPLSGLAGAGNSVLGDGVSSLASGQGLTAGLTAGLGGLLKQGVGAVSGGIGSLFGGLFGGGGGATAGLAGAGAAGGGGIGSLLGGLGSLFGFATGGAFDVPGSGGTDSKVVAFKATPGENVAVTTPGQQRDAAGGQQPQINQKIVNVQDPNSALDALQTNQGEKVLMNFIQSNPEAIKRALG